MLKLKAQEVKARRKLALSNLRRIASKVPQSGHIHTRIAEIENYTRSAYNERLMDFPIAERFLYALQEMEESGTSPIWQDLGNHSSITIPIEEADDPYTITSIIKHLHTKGYSSCCGKGYVQVFIHRDRTKLKKKARR